MDPKLLLVAGQSSTIYSFGAAIKILCSYTLNGGVWCSRFSVRASSCIHMNSYQIVCNTSDITYSEMEIPQLIRSLILSITRNYRQQDKFCSLSLGWFLSTTNVHLIVKFVLNPFDIYSGNIVGNLYPKCLGLLNRLNYLRIWNVLWSHHLLS